MSTGSAYNFTGDYTLKAIGGGSSKDNIVMYSEEQIFSYNNRDA